MRWKRKKPLWPLLVALGCLFFLTIAAPLKWQGKGQGTVARTETSPCAVEIPTVVVVQSQHRYDGETKLATPPILPPLEGQTFTLSDDTRKTSERADYQYFQSLQEFDIGTLLEMRDVSLSAIDLLNKTTPAQGPSLQNDPACVQVSSVKDRIAMVDWREGWRRPLPHQPAARDPDPNDVFAEELQRDTSEQGTSVPGPTRLAQRSRTHANLVKSTADSQGPLLRTRPSGLIKQLRSLTGLAHPPDWVSQALVRVEQLAGENCKSGFDVRATLNELQQLADAGINHSDALRQHDAQLAALALKRRLGIWHVLLNDTRLPRTPISTVTSSNSEALIKRLGHIRSLLAGEENGAQWRTYLMLDQLDAVTSESMQQGRAGRREVAQTVLGRLEDPQLSDFQREFLATEPLAGLRQQLLPWAAGPVDLQKLDALVDRYETGHETRYAVAIARLQERLRWSDDLSSQTLAGHLEENYRGANIRIAISDALMDRIMPKQESTVSPVRENVAGAKVFGKSRTTTQLRVRFLPDADTWRCVLEAFGKVHSETRSQTWPARVRNAAKMQFQARKLIVVDQNGLRTSPAKAQAQGRNELIGIDSQLDSVPIVGFLLRDMARRKHDKARPTALNQVKSKVAGTARRKMDREANPKLVRLEQKFRDNVLEPLGQLALLAEPLTMYTTEKRAVMNVRLANREQLAAHTPRPYAPSDSLASVQVHETVLNNAISGLQLDGKQMTLVQLFDFFAERFGRATATPPADLPRRAVIEFASRDAMQIRCDGDRVEVVLCIAKLALGRDKIKNFEVHAFFRPVMKGLKVQLVRDGSLQFAGRRLKTGPRVVLHSVIGKLLPKDQEIDVLHTDLEVDPRMAGLMVTQLEIDKGWIALALGPAHPQRTTWRTPQERLLSAPFVR
ncbi:MAG: hypothetical protein MK171_02860 [Pirellulales bacterium]|nr:hypothetical protein [Pirellulales bacterium]